DRPRPADAPSKIPTQKVSNFDLDPPMDRSAVDGGSILAGRGLLSLLCGRAWIDKYEMAARHRLLPRRMGQCRCESEDVALSLEIAAFRAIEQRRHLDGRQPVPIEQSAPRLHQDESFH